MTLTDLIKRFDDHNIPHNWDIHLELPGEYFDLCGISVIDQGEIGLVFNDHQRIKALEEDPEQYEVPSCR